ncbi:MAG: dihydropteroate synthase [Phycisphaerales bacterium]|jgi:dihydropteroate synthase|nr:dihydropteroate synthase [Phycisphaerales bacterium]
MKKIETSWNCLDCSLSLEKPILVGILNVTPDSFSDGGSFVKQELAISHALKMAEEGASMIDVGGESTRPGASRVSPEEQIKRIIPVIEGIVNKSNICISVDTTSYEVAKRAIAAGVSVINDVSAGNESENMFSLAAETNVGLVLMHRRLSPELDNYSNEYYEDPQSDDIVSDVSEWLMNRVDLALSDGVSKDSIAIDPGLGFGKSVEQNIELMENMAHFVHLGFPVYVGVSRKSFVGVTTGIESPCMRDRDSALMALNIFEQGAQIFRVHNISEHVRVLQSQLN